MTLALIHMISIPIDNTSVNPARSFGVAIFAGGEAMTQLWAFFVFPLASIPQRVVGTATCQAPSSLLHQNHLLPEHQTFVELGERLKSP
jgi:hypothetical protein